MKLSVVMLAYNHERYIAQALQSVLDQQTNFDYEIVIGEDCSTDRTREIISDFQRRHTERISPIFRKHNVGAGKNSVEAISKCRGEYVAFLEGDDYWLPADKLQRQVDFLDGHPDHAISCGRARVVDETSLSTGETLPARPPGSYDISDLLRGNFIYTCTQTWRRALLRTLPTWFEKMPLGDWPLSLLLARFGKINLCDEVLAAYRVHQASTWSSRPSARRLHPSIRMLAVIRRELDPRHESLISQTIARYYRSWINLTWESRNRSEAVSCVMEGLRSGAYKEKEISTMMRGLALFAVFGSWLPALSKAKRSLLR